VPAQQVDLSIEIGYSDSAAAVELVAVEPVADVNYTH
jgi:hypothetical protein